MRYACVCEEGQEGRGGDKVRLACRRTGNTSGARESTGTGHAMTRGFRPPLRQWRWRGAAARWLSRPAHLEDPASCWRSGSTSHRSSASGGNRLASPLQRRRCSSAVQSCNAVVRCSHCGIIRHTRHPTKVCGGDTACSPACLLPAATLLPISPPSPPSPPPPATPTQTPTPVQVASHQQAHAVGAPVQELVNHHLRQRILHHRPRLRHARPLGPKRAATAVSIVTAAAAAASLLQAANAAGAATTRGGG